MSNLNIEDTIFNDGMAINPYPMGQRFLALLDENRAQNKDWKQDKRIERLLFLVMVTWNPSLQLGEINFNDWWAQLNAQRDAKP